MKKMKIFVALMASMISGTMFGQTITANDINIEKGKTADVTFTITSETKAALAEFKMTLPEGITVKYDEDEEEYIYELGSSMTLKSHGATVKKQESGAYYVLVSNSSKKEFKAASGDYLTLTLEASENAVPGAALMKNILLVDIDAKQMNTVTEYSFNISVNGVTGITDIDADASKAPVYDLSGRRVQKAGKGLYIQNGKKVAVK